ncbi:hypothetical protein [Muribacter muris]|nr:hypothetical protein [Muribacter muris]
MMQSQIEILGERKLVDVYGWDGGFYALIIACLLGFSFIAVTLFHTPQK